MNEESQNPPPPELTATATHMSVQQGSPFHERPPAAAQGEVTLLRMPLQQGASLLPHTTPRMGIQGSENASNNNKRDGIMVADGAKNSPQKRTKRVTQQPQQDPFDLLTDDGMLFPIFAFIGSDHFRFIAGVSKRWRRLYSQFQREEYRKRVPNEVEFNKLVSTSLTSTASIAESISRANVFLDDMGTNPIGTIQIQENGSQEIGRFITPRPCDYLKDVAVHYGCVEILLLATENGCTCDVMTSAKAASHGQLKVLQWLRKNGCPWDQNTCRWAAEKGHLDVLKWLRENGCPWNEWTCSAAARNGHLEVLRWARENGCPWDTVTCSAAAQNGHLGVLQWARENGCSWDEDTCSAAAQNGHLEVLQWARQNGCPWDTRTCTGAAGSGHLEVLQWARQNGCPWDEWTCSVAAETGHLEVLQWARQNGCPWGRRTCSFAAGSGHLEVLQWARQNGCPWDKKRSGFAAQGGHLEVLQWAIEYGCEWDRQSFRWQANGLLDT